MVPKDFIRRLQRLEQRLIPDAPMEFTIHFVRPDGEIVNTVVMGPNGRHTWTKRDEPNGPRTWTE